jgi:branched-chain amino acid transport system permease protein
MTLDLLVNGLAGGAIVALLAAGFFASYSIARTFHVALAAVYALSPFVYIEVLRQGNDKWIAIAGAVIGGACLSTLCEVVNHGPLRRRTASPEAHLLSSLGIYVMVVQLIMMRWGPEVRLTRKGLEDTYTFAGVTLRYSQLIALATAIAVLAPLHWIFSRSRLGLVLRGLRDNPVEIQLLGVRGETLRVSLFALAGALAATAALLGSMESGFQAFAGFPRLLLAVVATLSIPGARLGAVLAGGLILGVVRTLCIWYVGARWQDTLSFGLFAVALALHSSDRLRNRAEPQ